MQQSNGFSWASRVISQAKISDVWRWLGGPPLRDNRGQAFWRNGDGWNVSLRDDQNVWYDFAASEGGGIIALVAKVLQCDRRQALCWLASKVGVQTDSLMADHPRAPISRERNRAANLVATQVVRWRSQALRSMRSLRNAYWDAERAVSRWAARSLRSPELAHDPMWDEVWTFCLYDQKGDQIEDFIKNFEQASPKELIDMHKQLSNKETS